MVEAHIACSNSSRNEMGPGSGIRAQGATAGPRFHLLPLAPRLSEMRALPPHATRAFGPPVSAIICSAIIAFIASEGNDDHHTRRDGWPAVWRRTRAATVAVKRRVTPLWHTSLPILVSPSNCSHSLSLARISTTAHLAANAWLFRCTPWRQCKPTRLEESF